MSDLSVTKTPEFKALPHWMCKAFVFGKAPHRPSSCSYTLLILVLALPVPFRYKISMEKGSDSSRAARALQRLRKPSLGGLESSIEGPPDLSTERIKSSLEAARERFRRIVERTKSGEAVTTEQARVLADAEAALKKLATEGDEAELSDRQVIGLEAIIVDDGTRPALFVQDDDVDPTVKEADTWQGRISELRTGIAQVSRSVGRINSAIGFPNYAGTGFVIAPGLIVTNRHVLELLVGGPKPQPDGSWKFLKPVTIDFAAEFERDRKREFEVTGVVFAGPEPINQVVQPPKLDVALLTVAGSNGEENLPPPLALSRRIKFLERGSEVYVMGYPARPRDEVGEVLMQVFQDEYFVKRFAPGLVEKDPDTFDDGGHKRVFTYDPSTLGGNSGSCVVEFLLQGKAVVGLHFGGLKREENYAHSMARVEEVLAEHGAAFQDR